MTGNHSEAALYSCSLAGIDLMRRDKVRLEQLRNALQLSLIQAEGSGSWNDFLSKSLLGANLVKATCDAFIDMAGAIGDAAGIKGADAIARGYSATSAVAGSASSAMMGQKTDLLDTGMMVAKAVNKNDIVELKLFEADIITAAIQQDNAKVLKTTFLGYMSKVAQMSLNYMKKEAKAKWLNAVTATANAGHSYSKALEQAFDARLSDLEETRFKKEMLNKMHHQIGIASAKIREIDAIMSDCVKQIQLL